MVHSAVNLVDLDALTHVLNLHFLREVTVPDYRTIRQFLLESEQAARFIVAPGEQFPAISDGCRVELTG